MPWQPLCLANSRSVFRRSRSTPFRRQNVRALGRIEGTCELTSMLIRLRAIDLISYAGAHRQGHRGLPGRDSLVGLSIAPISNTELETANTSQWLPSFDPLPRYAMRRDEMLKWIMWTTLTPRTRLHSQRAPTIHHPVCAPLSRAEMVHSC